MCHFRTCLGHALALTNNVQKRYANEQQLYFASFSGPVISTNCRRFYVFNVVYENATLFGLNEKRFDVLWRLAIDDRRFKRDRHAPKRKCRKHSQVQIKHRPDVRRHYSYVRRVIAGVRYTRGFHGPAANPSPIWRIAIAIVYRYASRIRRPSKEKK